MGSLGYNFPVTVAPSVGSWTNPDNVKAEDGSYASATAGWQTTYSSPGVYDYRTLVALDCVNFSFSPPKYAYAASLVFKVKAYISAAQDRQEIYASISGSSFNGVVTSSAKQNLGTGLTEFTFSFAFPDPPLGLPSPGYSEWATVRLSLSLAAYADDRSSTPSLPTFYVDSVKALLQYKCPQLTISTVVLPDGTFSATYSEELLYSVSNWVPGGMEPAAWTVVSGTPPPGITLSTRDASRAYRGLLFGAPLRGGTYTFTVRLSFVSGCTEGYTDKTLTMKVVCPSGVAINPGVGGTLDSNQLAYSGSAFSIDPSGSPSGGVWSISSGVVPTGLTLNQLTGKISGTPTVAGVFSFRLQYASPCDGTIATKDFSVTVAATVLKSFTDYISSTYDAVSKSAVSYDTFFPKSQKGFMLEVDSNAWGQLGYNPSTGLFCLQDGTLVATTHRNGNIYEVDKKSGIIIDQPVAWELLTGFINLGPKDELANVASPYLSEAVKRIRQVVLDISCQMSVQVVVKTETEERAFPVEVGTGLNELSRTICGIARDLTGVNVAFGLKGDQEDPCFGMYYVVPATSTEVWKVFYLQTGMTRVIRDGEYFVYEVMQDRDNPALLGGIDIEDVSLPWRLRTSSCVTESGGTNCRTSTTEASRGKWYTRSVFLGPQVGTVIRNMLAVAYGNISGSPPGYHRTYFMNPRIEKPLGTLVEKLEIRRDVVPTTNASGLTCYGAVNYNPEFTLVGYGTRIKPRTGMGL